MYDSCRLLKGLEFQQEVLCTRFFNYHKEAQATSHGAIKLGVVKGFLLNLTKTKRFRVDAVSLPVIPLVLDSLPHN